jgi:hypothetical protein
MLARSLLTIACGGCLLALLAVPGAQAQSPTAPTGFYRPGSDRRNLAEGQQQIRRRTRRAAQTSGGCRSSRPLSS